MKVMETKIDIQHNRLIHLEHSMLMYGVYNAKTLEKLINTDHDIYITTATNERLFARELRTQLLLGMSIKMELIIIL